MPNNDRRYAPATERNRKHIFDCLVDRLPRRGTILEIASGTGEHAAYLSPLFPHVNWQPTNLDEPQLKSARAWREHVACPSLLEVLKLDAKDSVWPVENADYAHAPITGLFNANMIHIAPWSVCKGLMAGAGRVLETGGTMFLYGPFKINGEHTSDSNVKFEKWLTDQNSEFGVRHLEDVKAEAENNGLILQESCPMPANNFIQVFQKRI